MKYLIYSIYGGATFILIVAVLPVLFGKLISDKLGVPKKDYPTVIAYSLGLLVAISALIIDLTMRISYILIPSDILRLDEKYSIIRNMALLSPVLILYGYIIIKSINSKKKIYKYVYEFYNILSKNEKLLAALSLVLVLYFIVFNIAQPLRGHDAIVHTYIGQQLFYKGSVEGYPYNVADKDSGFYFEATHPLGFSASKTLFMLINNDAYTPWHKALTSIYLIYLIIAVMALYIRDNGYKNSILIAFFILSIPIFIIYSVGTAHIDPLRVYFFFLPFAFLYEYIRSNYSKFWIFLIGLASALSLHVHAGNILLPIFIVPAYFILSNESIYNKLKNIMVVAIFVLVLSGYQYIQNIMIYGSPVMSDYSVANIPSLMYKEYMLFRRGVSNLYEKVLFGIFHVFTDLRNFSIFFWGSAIGIYLYIRNSRALSVSAKMGIIQIIIFFSLQIIAIIFDIDAFYKNARYSLIIIPFFAYFFPFFIELIRKENHIYIYRVMYIYIFIMMIFSLKYISPYAWTPKNIFKGDKYKVISLFNGDEKYPLSMDRLGYIYPSIITNNIDIGGKKVLTFRDADFLYYGRGRVVSHLDKRMARFYNSKSLSEAIEVLGGLDIGYAYVPNYTAPTIKNSYLKDIIYSPNISSVIAESEGYMLLKFKRGMHGKVKMVQIFSEDNYNVIPPGVYSRGINYPGYNKGKLIYISTEVSRREYILNLNIEGAGCIYVSAKYKSKDIWGFNVKWSYIYIVNIGGEDREVFRFVKPFGVSGISFNIKNVCSSSAKIRSMSLYAVRD